VDRRNNMRAWIVHGAPPSIRPMIGTAGSHQRDGAPVPPVTVARATRTINNRNHPPDRPGHSRISGDLWGLIRPIARTRLWNV
jgi:hypothetical protein